MPDCNFHVFAIYWCMHKMITLSVHFADMHTTWHDTLLSFQLGEEKEKREREWKKTANIFWAKGQVIFFAIVVWGQIKGGFMGVRDSESLLLCGMLRDTRHLCAFIQDYEMSYLSIHLREGAAILCVWVCWRGYMAEKYVIVATHSH